MPIRLSCDQCGRDYKVKTKLAGQRFRCKNCRHMMLIPTAVAAPAGAESPDHAEASGASISTQSLPLGEGEGSPPSSDSTPLHPVSQPARSKSSPRSLRGKVPWKTLIGSLLGLLIVAMIIPSWGKNLERDSAVKEKPPKDAEQEFDTEDFQALLDVGLNPEHYTRSLADVVDDLQKQDAVRYLPWQEFAYPGEPISVLMPGTPQPITRQENGITIRGAAVDIKPERGGRYGILFLDDKIAPGDAIDIDRLFEGPKQKMLNGVPFGRLTDERTLSITDAGGNEHPGRELQIDGTVLSKEMKYVYRIYMVGTKMIIAFTAMEQKYAEVFQPNSAKFLDSLRITAAVAPLSSNQRSEKPAAE